MFTFYPLCFLNWKKIWSYTSTSAQVGIPIAAGMLLPITGTMLTPSIAGALMGLSSIGVMANSLLLRLRFSSNKKPIHGSYENPKIHFDSDPDMGQKEKIEHSYSDARWREK